MALNNISTLATKELKLQAKLELASAKRQGYTVNLDGTVDDGAVANTNEPFYRVLNQYSITALPTQYVDNTILDNPNTTGLLASRPWH